MRGEAAVLVPPPVREQKTIADRHRFMFIIMKETVRGTLQSVGKKRGIVQTSQRGRSSTGYGVPHKDSPKAVFETDSTKYGTRSNIETLLSDIVERLERIEEKIDENVYPPESAIRLEYIKKVKTARSDIAAGKGKEYDSMDAFLRAVSE